MAVNKGFLSLTAEGDCVHVFTSRVGDDDVALEFYRLLHVSVYIFCLYPTMGTSVPFNLEIFFFFCYFSWLAVLINLDVVWLVSPYKCSLLIKLKFCSLSVNPISARVCCIEAVISKPDREGERRKENTPYRLFCFAFPDKPVRGISRVKTEVLLLKLVFSCLWLPPLTVLYASAENLSLRIHLWHVAGREKKNP